MGRFRGCCWALPWDTTNSLKLCMGLWFSGRGKSNMNFPLEPCAKCKDSPEPLHSLSRKERTREFRDRGTGPCSCLGTCVEVNAASLPCSHLPVYIILHHWNSAYLCSQTLQPLYLPVSPKPVAPPWCPCMFSILNKTTPPHVLWKAILKAVTYLYSCLLWPWSSLSLFLPKKIFACTVICERDPFPRCGDAERKINFYYLLPVKERKLPFKLRGEIAFNG